MPAIFPSKDWLKELDSRLNSDEQYRNIAHRWEGDLFVVIEADGNLKEPFTLYLDLWHGSCRKAEFKPERTSHPNPAFVLTASYSNIVAILSGNLNPMTAMLTGKLHVKGSMGYMMRNFRTVFDFVRVAQSVTTEIL